jgi:uncharacterized membrane protein YfcA
VEVVAALAVLFGSIVQAITGFGFGLVSAPFLVAAYGAPEGVQISLVVSAVLNVLLLSTTWRRADRPAVVRLLIPAVVATIGVGLLVRGQQNDGLTVLAGALCLAGVLVVARGRTFARLGGRTGAAVTGALSGAMGVMTGIGGPPVVLFGATAGWVPEVARPTLQLFFLGSGLVAIATLGLPPDLPWLTMGAMAAGTAIGHPLTRRLHADHVRVAVLLVAGGGSLLAIVRGLT